MLAVAGVSAAACRSPGEGLPYYADTTRTPVWPAARELASLPRTGDFALLDQRGRPITADSLSGRVHVANFFFTRCGDVCPLTRAQLLRVQAAFAADERVRLVSFSIAGDADTPDTLRAYGDRFGVDPDRWLLLAGRRDEIVRLAHEEYLIGLGAARDYGGRSVAHTEMVVLVDGDRRIRGIYNGTLALDIQQLEADLRVLLATDGG